MKKFLSSSPVVYLITFLLIYTVSTSLISAEEKSLEGTFTHLIGEVKVKSTNSNEWVNAEQNMPVYRGDKIRTGTNSEAEITFDEGTVIRLEAKSFLIIEETVFEEKTKVNKFIIRAESGRILSNLEKSVKAKSKFEIRGPGGTVAATRGTEFVFEVAEDKSVQVAVFGGKVGVKNEQVAPGKEILVEQEKETLIKLGSEPERPRALTEKMLKYREEKVLAFRKRVEANRMKLEEVRKRKLEWIEKKKLKRSEDIEMRKKIREEKLRKKLERIHKGGEKEK